MAAGTCAHATTLARRSRGRNGRGVRAEASPSVCPPGGARQVPRRRTAGTRYHPRGARRRAGRRRRVLEQDAAHLLDGRRLGLHARVRASHHQLRFDALDVGALRTSPRRRQAPSSGPSSSTAMIEWAVTRRDHGNLRTSALMKRWPGDMLSMLVGTRPLASAPVGPDGREIGADASPHPRAAAPAAGRAGARAGARPGSCRDGASRGRSRAARTAAASRTATSRSSSRSRPIELHVLERLVADLAPEAVARVDRRQLGEQPALAVAHHDHVAQAGVRAARIRARHRLRERAAELPRRSRRWDCPSRSGRTRTRSGGAAADRRSGRSPCRPSAPGSRRCRARTRRGCGPAR